MTTMALNDSLRALIRKAQAGDRASFDALTRKYQGRLEALIRSRMGARMRKILEPEDVLQETLVRGFQSIDGFRWRGEDSFLRWLGAIAENLILNASKQVGRHQNLRLDRSLAGTGTAPSRALRREERFERLRDSVESLSEDHRTVILLTRIEGLSIEETAARMQRSESAVKNLLLRALKNLRRSFDHTESLNLPDRRLGAEGEDDGE